MRLIDADELKTKSPSDTLEDFSISNAICKIIDKQPTIEVESIRYGHWVSSDITDTHVAYCSVCGIGFYDVINNHRFVHHYCPNCGAKMDGMVKE